MRRTVAIVLNALLLAGSAAAAERSPRALRGFPGFAVAAADVDLDSADLTQPTVGKRPVVLLETDYYVYPYTNPDSGLQVTAPEVRLTLDPNGSTAPVRLYLFWENRTTGERRYLSADRGLLPSGQVEDLFGVPVHAPALADFPLLGATGALGMAPVQPTGRYQFVVELRDAAGERVVAGSNAMYAHVDAVVAVPGGDLRGDTTWTANNAYYLDGPVYVGGNPLTGTPEPSTLTIEPGTVILASKVNQGTLIVVRDSKMYAVGTPLQPIVFTAEAVVGTRTPGEWGGLVINGNAPCNQPDLLGEGDSGPFCGDDPADSSGALQYVRVEFAGIRFSEQNELNGIALQGVGTGTVIRNVQVHFNQDDGIEFFGGTVNAENVLITDAEDDSVDWVYGWSGTLNNLVVLQRHPDADAGVEADNFENDPDALPRSMPKIFNATWVGNADVSASPGSGLRLRRGTGAIIRNAIVMNFGSEQLRIEGAETFGQLAAGDLLVDNSILFDPTNDYDWSRSSDPAAVAAMVAAGQVLLTDPMLADPLHPMVPDVRPMAGSPALDAANAAPRSYIGGVNPFDPWIYQGWTTFSDN